MWRLIKSDVVFPITIIGTMSARTASTLFTTFLNLYGTQQYPGDKKASEALISRVNLISVFMAFLVVIPVGQTIDRYPARWIIPIIFLAMAGSLILF